MIDGAIDPIPEPGDDAYQNGALNKAYLGKIVSRLNRPETIILPPNLGSATVIQSAENKVYDFSKAFGTNTVIWLAVDGVAKRFGVLLVRLPDL